VSKGSDRRLPEQATLRRMRWPLLGLAALALERLQEGGLLAQHVGALHRPHADGELHPGLEEVGTDEAGLLSGSDRALEQSHDLRVFAAHGDDRFSGGDGECRDRGALDDGVRVSLHQVTVSAARRIRAVAVRDHVPPLAGKP
jgi:hypothetical protein